MRQLPRARGFFGSGAGKKVRSGACRKPGSVPASGSKTLWRAVNIHLVPGLLRTSSELTRRLPAGSRTDAFRRPCLPICSCSRWGFPCRPHHCERGALLPHLFTLAWAPFGVRGRYVFCGTFRRVAPPGRWPAPCPVEPGLSSRAIFRRRRLPKPAPDRGAPLVGNERVEKGESPAGEGQKQFDFHRSMSFWARFFPAAQAHSFVLSIHFFPELLNHER